jgi:glycosyltransferase involved in cell wall biosynthesis
MEEKVANNPKISLVMPVYNEEKYLQESIPSILNQTFGDFEFIIIDNGSKDRSLEIIKSYKDERIKLIHLDVNIGAAKAVNMGIKIAKGKYIASFCADDISDPKRFELEFDYLEKNPHIFLVGASAIYIDENGKEIRRFRKYNDYKMLAWRLRKGCSIVYPSIMFRNEGFYLDSSLLADDHNFYLVLLKNGKNLTNISPFLVKHRVHSQSISVYDCETLEKAEAQVLKKFKELKDETNLFDKTYFSTKLFFHFIRTIPEKKIVQNFFKRKKE